MVPKLWVAPHHCVGCTLKGIGPVTGSPMAPQQSKNCEFPAILSF